MSATPIKTVVQHPLRYWWFWITVAVIAALSTTFAAYFLLGGLIARNMPPDRILAAVLFGLSTISLLAPTSFFLRIAGRVLDPDAAARNAETGTGGGRGRPALLNQAGEAKTSRPWNPNNTREKGKWES